MNYQFLKEELGKRKKGTILSVEYKSQPTLSASAKKLGIQVEKITRTQARFGINYSNIKAVKEQREQDKELGIERQAKAIWWHWKDKNLIKEHNTNGNLYLTLTTSKIAKPKVEYFINGKKTTKEELQNQNIVINSYWKEKEQPLQQYDININNIIAIKEKKC